MAIRTGQSAFLTVIALLARIQSAVATHFITALVGTSITGKRKAFRWIDADGIIVCTINEPFSVSAETLLPIIALLSRIDDAVSADGAGETGERILRIRQAADDTGVSATFRIAYDTGRLFASFFYTAIGCTTFIQRDEDATLRYFTIRIILADVLAVDAAEAGLEASPSVRAGVCVLVTGDGRCVFTIAFHKAAGVGCVDAGGIEAIESIQERIAGDRVILFACICAGITLFAAFHCSVAADGKGTVVIA